jgi:hypothetical protein
VPWSRDHSRGQLASAIAEKTGKAAAGAGKSLPDKGVGADDLPGRPGRSYAFLNHLQPQRSVRVCGTLRLLSVSHPR